MANFKTQKRQSKILIAALMLLTLLIICLVKVMILKANWVDDKNGLNLCNMETHKDCLRGTTCNATVGDCDRMIFHNGICYLYLSNINFITIFNS